jgi:ATP-dependent DNA ligase
VDGYRALILKQPARVYMRSRNDKDLTETYGSVRGQQPSG